MNFIYFLNCLYANSQIKVRILRLSLDKDKSDNRMIHFKHIYFVIFTYIIGHIKESDYNMRMIL